MTNSPVNYASQPQVPRPISQTVSQLSQLREVLDLIDKLGCELESRLEPFTRSHAGAQSEKVGPAAPDEVLVPHADSIRSQRKIATAISVRLQSLLERLEA